MTYEQIIAVKDQIIDNYRKVVSNQNEIIRILSKQAGVDAPEELPSVELPGEHEAFGELAKEFNENLEKSLTPAPPLLELREILEMAFMGHWIKDEEGNFVQINDKHYVLRDGLKYQIEALFNSKLTETYNKGYADGKESVATMERIRTGDQS